METILCYNCMEIFDIEEPEEYYEREQEETLTIEECPHCKEKNSIYFIYSVNFSWRKPYEDDLDNFNNN